MSTKSGYELSSTVYFVSHIPLENVDILALSNQVRGLFSRLTMDHVLKKRLLARLKTPDYVKQKKLTLNIDDRKHFLIQEVLLTPQVLTQ